MHTFTTEKPEIKLAGISVRTTNAEETGPHGRLSGLWESYFASGMASEKGITNAYFIYALYTDYESDASGAYTVVIGHEAGDDAILIATNVEYAVIPKSKYLVFTTKRGPVHEVVFQAWVDIWAYFDGSPEERAYTGDFELYDARNLDPADAEVQIYIAIK